MVITGGKLFSRVILGQVLLSSLYTSTALEIYI